MDTEKIPAPVELNFRTLVQLHESSYEQAMLNGLLAQAQANGFLNIADGIASAHGKKVIFSTNLPNLRDIDEALVRPGRCFAHVFMEELRPAEAITLLDRLCAETPERRSGAAAALNVTGQKSFSVAEVYAAHRNAGPQRGRTRVLQLGAARVSERVVFGFN